MGRKSKIEKTVDEITHSIDIPFMEMDRCYTCGGYDTMQVYVTYKGKFVHICEKCYDKFFVKK